MSTMASQITSVSIVNSTVCSGADQRKHHTHERHVASPRSRGNSLLNNGQACINLANPLQTIWPYFSTDIPYLYAIHQFRWKGQCVIEIQLLNTPHDQASSLPGICVELYSTHWIHRIECTVSQQGVAMDLASKITCYAVLPRYDTPDYRTAWRDKHSGLDVNNSHPAINIPLTLHWRHNGRGGASYPQPHDCFLNRLFMRRWKKTSKLRVTGLCAGNSPVTGEFPAQMASDSENVSIGWRHHESHTLFHVGCCNSWIPSLQIWLCEITGEDRESMVNYIPQIYDDVMSYQYPRIDVWGLICYHGLSLIHAWISNHMHRMKILIHSRTSTVEHWSLGMD